MQAPDAAPETPEAGTGTDPGAGTGTGTGTDPGTGTGTGTGSQKLPDSELPNPAAVTAVDSGSLTTPV